MQAPTVEKSQVPQLVESHTPEQLAALKAALEQLGAKLDAAGSAPDGQAEVSLQHYHASVVC